MTLYTIIYNGYGQFLDQWLENAYNQIVKPDEIIVVLGENHGVDKSKYENIKFIESSSNVMGVLRNLAICEIKTEWMLYFSVDDILLPNAISEIMKYKDYDVVALTYNDCYTNGKILKRKSAIFNRYNIRRWSTHYNVPGYCAVRRIIKESVNYYEDIEIPNYPYLFMLCSKTDKQIQTSEVVAIYKRRDNSHGDISYKESRWIEFKKYIDSRALYYSKR